MIKVCGFCGREYKTKHSEQKYCSRKCFIEVFKEEHKGISITTIKRKTYICKNCGKKFTPRASTVATYCSRECAFEYKSIHTGRYCKECGKELKGGQRVYCSNECENNSNTKLCVQCGAEFISYIPGAKFCSDICRNNHIKQICNKNRIDYTKTCIECGKTFKTYRSNQICCSGKCSDKRENRLRDLNRRHKLRENGKVDYSITLKKLFERDKGICHICGKKVNVCVDANDNEYGSIDHVLPVSKGGTHTWDNVKLAHRICNSLKKDNIYIEDVKGQFKISI